MTGPPAPGAAVYLLADTSGSTVRDGFNAGWNFALPLLVALAEQSDGGRISFLSYADDAALHVRLTPARDLTMIPWMPPGGLSSMAAGLRLLGRTIGEDRRQLRSDGLPPARAVTVVVADGLPTDADEEVLDAREQLAREATALHVAAPPGEDLLALAGLRAAVHPVRAGDAATVAGSIVAAAQAALTASGGPQ